MQLVKRNGCFHVRDGEKFVRLNWHNVSRAMQKSVDKRGRRYTKNELLAMATFDEHGVCITD